VVLFGLAVNNAIILYEVSGEYQNKGLSLALAAYRGARDRLNPILATTATTLLALLPVMISPLDAVQRSMAAAMFGGVAASTLISLLVLPPLLTWFRAVPGEVDRWKRCTCLTAPCCGKPPDLSRPSFPVYGDAGP